jgi:diguanylate cyclase (GGDEF)-like protein
MLFSLMDRVKVVIALVLATSLAAIAMIAVLQARSDASRRAQAELGQVSGKLNERTTVPVGVMFGAPSPLVQLRMAQLRVEVESTVRDLRAETPVPTLDEVDRTIDRSLTSGDAVMALMRQMATNKGRAAIAQALAGNDPALNRLLAEAQKSAADVAAALEVARDEYARRAERARRQATVGSAGAIALLVLAFGVAFRRSLRARADAELLAAENARMAEASQQEALTDALTELGNRRALIADLGEALDGSDFEPVVLALFDLDGFKQYNDSFGHQAGDALLRRLGERLAEMIDGRGSAYRMGGDEFCVLARLDGDDAVSIARLGADALSDSGDAFSIGCSYGIALAPSEASSAEEALRLADQRMYEQKSSGARVSATRQTADVLLQVLVEQDDRLADHGSGVADLAATTAERLGMTKYEVRQVHLAAQLHDVGKCAIPDAILRKPGPLDDEEWRFMRRHTLIGERIVRAAPSISHAAPLIRASHERVDGGGYPDGLHGEEIPLGARIIAVCDAFDAMVAERPYRSGVSVTDALAELRQCAGTQFDAAVVSEFCTLVTNDVEHARAA